VKKFSREAKTSNRKMWWSETAQRHEVPTAVLRNPNRPNRAVSSYRSLCDVKSATERRAMDGTAGFMIFLR